MSNAVMTSGQYRQRAQECLELARASNDVFVQVALTELAQEFGRAADQAERAGARERPAPDRARRVP
jgi:hypothetical protein